MFSRQSSSTCMDPVTKWHRGIGAAVDWSTGSPEKKNLIFSICWFLWYKISPPRSIFSYQHIPEYSPVGSCEPVGTGSSTYWEKPGMQWAQGRDRSRRRSHWKCLGGGTMVPQDLCFGCSVESRRERSSGYWGTGEETAAGTQGGWKLPSKHEQLVAGWLQMHKERKDTFPFWPWFWALCCQLFHLITLWSPLLNRSPSIPGPCQRWVAQKEATRDKVERRFYSSQWGLAELRRAQVLPWESSKNRSGQAQDWGHSRTPAAGSEQCWGHISRQKGEKD
jgi:hypothetical protein